MCDATRPPGKKPLAAALVKQVVELTLHQKPPNATHWTSRSMACAAGIGAGLFNALSERGGAGAAVKDVFLLSEGNPV